MAFVADPNFTNNFVSVDAFSPFPTGGGNKVLQLSKSGGGVLLSDSPSVANVSDVDVVAEVVIVSGGLVNISPDLGFILNRNASGDFYYLWVAMNNGGSFEASVSRYSDTSSTFTARVFSSAGGAIPFITLDTINEFRAIVRSSSRGPNLALLVNGETAISILDETASQINSGQVGVASRLISHTTDETIGAFVDNFFVRTID